jgi:N6-L-threonylcarbamoyladenine synthase
VRVLGIETSCDETAAAVVDDEFAVHSSIIESSLELHRDFGGVVPELAGRAHVEHLAGVVERALTGAGGSVREPTVDAIAVTSGPGLIGSLLVGLSAAKAYALAWGVPFVGVNHLEGHLYAPLLERGELRWPVMTLLVSGGHTMIVLQRELGHHEVLGETIDDAAGEAFDKVARWLGLGYPGGPAIDRLAASGDATSLALPVSMTGAGLDLSFSGLKTAVVRASQRDSDLSPADVAASFQAAVVEQLVRKLRRALESVPVASVALGGGVAANSALRAAVVELAEEFALEALLPSREMCTDNAAMIAAAGVVRQRHGASALTLPADPNWQLQDVS